MPLPAHPQSTLGLIPLEPSAVNVTSVLFLFRFLEKPFPYIAGCPARLLRLTGHESDQRHSVGGTRNLIICSKPEWSPRLVLFISRAALEIRESDGKLRHVSVLTFNHDQAASCMRVAIGV